MNLSFLPQKLLSALQNVNLNYLNEIRLRFGQPVILQYNGEYKYIDSYGLTESQTSAIKCGNVTEIVNSATEGSVYAFQEQIKCGFLTVGGGVRIGVAGEYVTDGGKVIAIKNITSLNIRIPHDVAGASSELYKALYESGVKNTLIFSPPGFGKTTVLRDLCRQISKHCNKNLLIFDERNEIYAADEYGKGFELGENCDVIRGADKLICFVNAVRAMRPQIILTDELYGTTDGEAVKFAAECGITLIATSHFTAREQLKKLPFENFVELTGIGKPAKIYDKDFNFICNCNIVGSIGNSAVG